MKKLVLFFIGLLCFLGAKADKITLAATETAVGEYTVDVSLTATKKYSAFQMDFVLPAGLSVKSVATESALSKFEQTHSQLSSGNERFAFYTNNNSTLSTGTRKLFSVVLSGTLTETAEVEAKNIRFTTAAGVETVFDRATVTLEVKKSYQITYMVDGKVYQTQEVLEGETITPLTAPEKEGYSFSKWNDLPTVMPSNDITVAATYTVNKYTVTYFVDGWSIATEKVAFGDTVPLPDAPEKEGYTFAGWKDVPATMPAQDIWVEAQYTPNKYKVTYVIDGKTYAEEEVEFGGIPGMDIADPEKEGYTFTGWTDLPDLMPANNVTTYGSFIINSYTITFKVDGEEVKTLTVEYGTDLAAILPAAPAKEGCTFSGWQDVPATMPAKNLTVSGTFTINSYTVTYVIDGEEIDRQTVEYGATIVPIEAPAKEGYTFNGWTDVPETMPAKDITVSGSYTKVPDTGISSARVAQGGTLVWRTLDGKPLPQQPIQKGVYLKGNQKVLVK